MCGELASGVWGGPLREGVLRERVRGTRAHACCGTAPAGRGRSDALRVVRLSGEAGRAVPFWAGKKGNGPQGKREPLGFAGGSGPEGEIGKKDGPRRVLAGPV